MPLAPPVRIAVDASRPTATVPRSLYGVFFEEINNAGEGGLYAEKLRNRGLVGDPDPKTGLPAGWRAEGDVTLDASGPLNPAHSRALRIVARDLPAAAVNEGFWGLGLKRGDRLALALWMKSDVPVVASLAGGSSASFPTTGGRWARYGANLVAGEDEPKGSLRIAPVGRGTVRLAYASLMPERTWKGRANGLRPDLANRVAAMRPGFVRFPGGCYVEGNDLGQAWNWKASLGPVEARPGTPRTQWGYPSSDGLGLHEYLQWCEDLGAEPLFVANVGMSHTGIEPIETMGRWVRDALDAIEYANGPATSRWGALRAKNGHPKPFGLKYVEIGNENGASWSFGGPAPYAPRYRMVYDAIKARYPGIVTIADNPVPHPMETLDEHYYDAPGWFWRNKDRYDGYDRPGPGKSAPRIYVGEYAVTRGAGGGNLAAALAEAAFMTGMERNADVVTMSSYAPLFVNDASRQWNPNAIVFDAARSYGTPSYWVQSLFARNRPSRILAATIAAPAPSAPTPSGDVGFTTWKTQAEFRDLKVERDGVPLDPFRLPARATGTWTSGNGTIAGTDPGEDRQYVLPGVDLAGARRVVMTVKARKTGGDEGFILLFGGRSDADRLQWNLGGWRNVKHAFQLNGNIVGPEVPGAIETGRWYDVRLERDGSRVRGFLDGKLVAEVELPTTPDLAAVAGRDDATGEIVVKVVNGAAESRDAEIDLGAFHPRGGTATVLAGPSLDAENAFDAPERVAPRTTRLARVASRFGYRMPPYSLSILRLRK